MVSSIQRGRPTQRKKLQGAVIPRGDAIITYTPDRTFGAYCMDGNMDGNMENSITYMYYKKYGR